MKKQNVIDITSYREELEKKAPEGEVIVHQGISDELKLAIEGLIARLRARENNDPNQ